MRKFAVCGLGNALVDFDFEVSDETLNRLSIEKGVMTLIDKHQERVLLEELDGKKHVKACGGSAANTIITVQQLGGASYYSCKIASDPTGDFFLNDLIKTGVKTNIHPDKREVGITGKCIAMITPDAERTMHTFLGVSSTLSINELSEPAIADSEYLYLEGYLVASDTAFEAGLEAIRIARKHKTKIALSLSDLNMVRFFFPRLQAFMQEGIDLLFCNSSEALLYTKQSAMYFAAEELCKIAKVAVITCSERGALLCSGTKHVFIDAYPVRAVDTIGAGDIFAGSFLYALSAGYNLELAGDIACLAASRVVTKFGPRLEPKQVQEVLRRMSILLEPKDKTA